MLHLDKLSVIIKICMKPFRVGESGVSVTIENRQGFLIVHILIFFNLLLAFSAFMKDIILAAFFGTSGVADAINLAFFIPDTIGYNLIGAAIAVSSIPILTKLSLHANPVLYRDTVQKVVVIISIGTLLLLIVFLFLFKPILHLFPNETHVYSITITRYFLYLSPIICGAPIWLMGSSVLQASRKFLIPAITPILFNLILLISLVWCEWQGVTQIYGGTVFSLACTVGTFLCCLLTWTVIFKDQNWNWSRQAFNLKSDVQEMRKMFSTFTAYVCILFFSQAGLFIERLFASSLETGTIAALTYAYRLAQFPLWVFIAAITTFILPTISLHFEKNDVALLKNDLIKSLLMVIGSAGLVSLTFVVFSEQVVRSLFLRGSFTVDSVKLTSDILKGYGLAIVGQSLYVFCTRYYVAQNKMKIPLLIGLGGSVLNIVLLYLFVPVFGARGIGYSVAISSTISGGLILVYFIKNLFHVVKVGGISDE